MPIWDANATGFCHGVARAVRRADAAAESAARKGQSAVIYGHLVHNQQQVAALEAKGIRHVADWRQEVPGTLVVRTHGIAPGELAEIEATGWDVVDATCPLVTRTHNRAESLREAGYQLIGVVGKADHPEVKALTSGDYGRTLVFQTVEDVERLLPDRWVSRLGVVIQSTFPPEPARAIIGELSLKAVDLRVFNTICDVTQSRLEAAAGIARQVQAMVVVGGYHSANTRQIADACRAIVTTYHVETAQELDPEWFAGLTDVGLASGLSTPGFEIDRVRTALIALVS
ncbi:MAG: 4-hydroxy-3-methylbut-2-enyl diphosphate reductase [Candidatus Sericytochromatia bacterium]|uniref:4-hydroxy-3-methylbut-2-enyl diphosphate reductase n=1 Tax=Candidatus Tanganyikabacteria bacterium TaxID=2961651 RepID=A0A938BLJ4_9BACT|nr:4-hydroxy-3-methylbut-2-enyl diphosphate reductase [Candidatus Tanganyikabacteria bacterium]